ncbi:phosphopantetheine-binding protein [Streptomyces sp. NPDC001982]|uniref:phosphopantetheine-binding protein n=1 Tax=Streptomyces sp. NPDC001982 TaxID=3154405 RepID=UPI00331B3602
MPGKSAEVCTADPADISPLQDGGDPGRATGTERLLAEVLAGILRVEQVPFDSHFFNDLGADSLVMAQFCARVTIISATRTAASAALAADRLTRDRQRPTRIGFFGSGLIARYIHTFLTATGWSFDETGVHDLSAASATGFRDYVQQAGTAGRITMHDDPEELIRSSDLVVFATIAGEPHVHDPAWFDHNPVVLHVSLRDLAPEIILASTNIVDDVEHCLKANTSPHLAEQLTGNRDFVHGTLADVMAGNVALPTDRPPRPEPPRVRTGYGSVRSAGPTMAPWPSTSSQAFQ